jgi:hypothetical protein
VRRPRALLVGFAACAAAAGCALDTVSSSDGGVHWEDTLTSGDALEAGAIAPDGSPGWTDAAPIDAEWRDAADCTPPTDASTCEVPRFDAGEPGTWSPAALPGLALWLDWSGIVVGPNDTLTGWVDWRGVLTAHPDPAALEPPTLGACPIRGRASVRSDHGGLRLEDDPHLQLAGDFAIFSVARYSNGGPNTDPYGVLYSKASGADGPGLTLLLNLPDGESGFGVRLVSSTPGPGVSASSTPRGCNDGRPRVYGGRLTGTRLELFLDGALVGSSTVVVPDLRAVGAPAFIGALGAAPAQHLAGDVFSLLLVDGTLSDADLARVTGYFASRFSLP